MNHKAYLLLQTDGTEAVSSSSYALGNIITFPGFHESHNGRLVFPRHIAKYT
jgi:hypothetical protein